MQPTPNCLPLPQNHERLARRIEEFSAAARPGRLSIALQLGGDPLFLHYDGPGSLRISDSARHSEVAAGCFAKALTASLLAEAVNARPVKWAWQVNDVLEVRGAAASNLAGITFSHLLNHTHGLDASTIESVPRTSGGFIDATALCEQLSTNPLSRPGELYSYSNAGAWLAGAALEHLTGTPYSRLLSASPCLASSDIVWSSPPSLLCPATGGSLALTLAQWLSFAQVHASSAPGSPDPAARGLAALRSSQVPLPGWSPAERAACLGWKCYGEGWFGHTSNTTTSSAILRFHPDDHLAICMSATTDIALFAFSCLFRDYFPELKYLKFPRRLTPKERESLRPEPYTGLYVQAKTQIEIAATEDGRLSFAIASDDPQLRAPPQILQAADNDIFFCDGRRTPEFSFLQFISAPHSSAPFSHIWNGKHLWRRQ
jgi:hypothetical protein